MSDGTVDLSLDERIAAAFTGDINSDDLADLADEVEDASDDASEAADRARKRALDPTLSPQEIAEARRQMEDAAFARDRMTAALPRLERRLKEVRDAEENARRRIAYEEAKAVRDGLAEELARVYPEIERTLGELIVRVHANDARLAVVNGALPSGAGGLRGAEEIARGLQGFRNGGSNIPRLTEMRLPAFTYTYERAYAWAPAWGSRPAGPAPG